MKKRIQITIPEPCNESWHKMTPNTQGSFCINCQKTVIDFTDKNNREIMAVFNTQTNVCGRFLPHQINQYISEEQQPTIAKWKVYLFSLFTFLNIESVIAQDTPSQKTIQGIVRDEKGEPLPGAYIYVEGNKQISTQTDIEGLFVLKNISDTSTVIFNFIGMEEQKITIKAQNTFDITLKEYSILGGCVVEEQKHPSLFKSIWLFISRPFRRKTKNTTENSCQHK